MALQVPLVAGPGAAAHIQRLTNRTVQVVGHGSASGSVEEVSITGLSSEGQPLKGLRIAVTRPPAQAQALIDGLRELGAEPLSYPTIRIADPSDRRPLRRAVENLENYDWIVFTSANGVVRFFQELRAVRGAAVLADNQYVAAIGPATAEALREHGVHPKVMPEEYVAEAVADALTAAADMAGCRVLLPRAAGARQVLTTQLCAAGAEVDEVVAYESKPDAEGIAALRASIERGELDVVTFTAASTVRHFVEEAGAELGRTRVAVIGPITAEAARALGVRVDIQARQYTAHGLVQAISEYFESVKGRD
ncbi:MAG: uroporphyrinogen-III synthase [Gemmatimonadota bacterium]|nr:MAG: uroporphyrinogen-III synthase [Gemmatimonadota bacterium]